MKYILFMCVLGSLLALMGVIKLYVKFRDGRPEALWFTLRWFVIGITLIMLADGIKFVTGVLEKCCSCGCN